MTHDHYLLNEVAKQVGRKSYQIAYLITTGVIEEPEIRINNKRVFRNNDVEKIRRVFQTRAANARKEAQ